MESSIQHTTRNSKVIWEEAASLPLLADPLIDAVHNCSTVLARCRQRVLCRLISPKIAVSCAGDGLRLTDGSLDEPDPCIKLTPNSISIESAVFPQYMHVTCRQTYRTDTELD